jgi:hypothetical protein
MSALGEEIARAATGRRPSTRGWVRLNCPACERRHGSPDRKASLGVHVFSGRWNCFRCHTRGRFDTGIEWEEEAPSSEPTPPVDPPEGYYPIFDGPGRDALSFAFARQYVREERGLSDEVAREAKIGACLTGKFARRVIIPVVDARGAWRWFIARDFCGTAFRPYLYPSGSRGGLLYNERALEVETDVPLLVVEGAFDALAHYPDAVAVLGKPTEDHVQKLIMARRPVVVVLDGDAWEEGDALALRLRVEGVTAGSLRLAPRVDPDEIETDELMAAARESLTV